MIQFIKSKNMKKIILLSFYMFCFATIFAQQPNRSTLKGHVLDEQTEEHLQSDTERL